MGETLTAFGQWFTSAEVWKQVGVAVLAALVISSPSLVPWLWRLWRGRTPTPSRLLQPRIDVRQESGGPSTTFRVHVTLFNAGREPIDRFRSEIRLPRGLIPDRTGMTDEEQSLSNKTHRVIVRTEQRYSRSGKVPIYPDTSLEVFGTEWEINEATWLHRSTLRDRALEVVVQADGMETQTASKNFDDLGLGGFAPSPIEVEDASRIRNRKVKDFIEAQSGVGQALNWRYESEVTGPPGPEGQPYCMIDGRRVVTYSNRGNGDRTKPPEYLVYA